MQNKQSKIFFQTVAEPTIDFTCDFSSDLRKEGLSGFMRLRNEAEFLQQAILSWIQILDELVIVFNNCQDNTEQIIRNCAEKYPEKIKIYHYLPQVYPPGSKHNCDLPSTSPHSLVHYYNFALSRTSLKWTIKIDGDLIIPTDEMRAKFREIYVDMSTHSPNEYLPVAGINLIDHYGKFYVPENSKYAGYNGDLSLFRCHNDSIFKKYNSLERLDLSERIISRKKRFFLYYHLKFVKQDFGINNYDFVGNPNSHYIQQNADFLRNIKLIPLEIIATKAKLPIVCCQDFAIRRKCHWRRQAIRNFLTAVNNSRTQNGLSEIRAKHLGLQNKYNPKAMLKLALSIFPQIYKLGNKIIRKILKFPKTKTIHNEKLS